MKLSTRVAALVMVALCFTGCGKDSGKSSADKSDYQPETSGDGTATAVVTPSRDDERSPASNSKSTLAADASPETVIEQYVQALNEYDIKRAENLLTDVAKLECRRAGLEPQQAWSASATYQITNVAYATERPIRAEVTTEWTERDASGASADFRIVWMLFKQAHNGWRISGMKTHFTAGGELVFLNFEDPSDMVARWEQGAAEARVESANANPDSTIR